MAPAAAAKPTACILCSENCGLQVIAVSLFELREGSGESESSIYSFDVQTSAGDRVDVDALGGVLSEAILAVRASWV